MKKAFTLVELLVAITVIAILMGIVIRFGNIGADASARAITVSRMQRLENGLSGYYAAFGTYPPVKLHGSRDIYLRVNDHNLQSDSGEQNKNLWGWLGTDGKVKNERAEANAWEQVRVACCSQPVAAYYPYSEDYKEIVQQLSEMMKEMAPTVPNLSDARRRVFAAGFDIGVDGNGSDSRFNGYREYEEWSEIQLFKFGVMSYLLPRYLFMMLGPVPFLEYAQWLGNNNVPSDPFTGDKYGGNGADSVTSWRRMRDEKRNDDEDNKAGAVKIGSIPSQSVCARWMPNFEKSLECSDPSLNFFGIEVMANMAGGSIGDGFNLGLFESLEVYTPGGYSQDSTSGQYILNTVTIKDGWDQEFYYYSPAPYQGYVLWSGGPNKRTFPPWIDKKELDGDGRQCVEYWIHDDIVGLSK